ncbi:extensin family protein [Phreatobacter cathodiphilus]|nr:extensin family protein [Phreatobacter cathodiphilus]
MTAGSVGSSACGASHGRDVRQPPRSDVCRHRLCGARHLQPVTAYAAGAGRGPVRSLSLAAACFAIATGAAAAPPASAPLPHPRPAGPAAPSPAPEPAAPEPAAPEPASPAPSTCHAALSALAVRFAPAEAPSSGAACRIEDPVRLEAMRANGTEIVWPDRPLVSCGFALVLAGFTRDAAQPLARALAGRPLTAFGTGGGFECRGRNRAAGARISAHGQGLAVDIAWFAFEGGVRERVEAPSGEAMSRFIGALRKAACGWFTTVLGPGSDAAHADHLHLDREPRGRNGESRLCQ